MNTRKIGDRVTGVDTTLGLTYTGTVAEVVHTVLPRGIVYRLTDTGQNYSNGRPIEPVVYA